MVRELRSLPRANLQCEIESLPECCARGCCYRCRQPYHRRAGPVSSQVRVLIDVLLMMASFGSHPIPSVLLNQLHEFSYFH
jgi:hypothetical protein